MTNLICKGCGQFKPIENRDTCLCASCNKDARNNSDLYPVVRKLFLDTMIRIGAVCPITGTPITEDSDIHHKKGRVGYASEEKRLKGISLLIDVDYFLAVSREGHQWIEMHPEEAKQKGYSESRLTHEDQ